MLDTVAAVYEVLKRYISTTDMRDAAEDVLNVLIDHDVHFDDVREAFSSEKEMLGALKAYQDDEADYDDDEDFADDEDYDDWNDNE
jgi:hypothetical protein